MDFSQSQIPPSPAPAQQIPSKQSRKLSIFFGFVVVLLLVAISSVVLLTWRTIAIDKTTRIYNHNHEQIILLSQKYALFLDEYKKNESRIYEADFASFQTVISSFNTETLDISNKFESSSNQIIVKQQELASEIITSIQKLLSSIDQYTEYISCIQQTETQIQNLNSEVGTINLVSNNQTNQQPDIDGIIKVRDYLTSQSTLVTQFDTCFKTDSTLDIIKDSDNALQIVSTYADSLNSLATTIDTLLDLIDKEQFAQAAELSIKIVSDQSELYNLAPENSLFVTSDQIMRESSDITSAILNYNLNHQNINFFTP